MIIKEMKHLFGQLHTFLFLIIIAALASSGCSKKGSGSGASAATATATIAPILAAINAISPATGFTGGANLITITGSNFQSGPSVVVGGGACTSVTVTSSTQLTCTAPSGTGTVDVKVTNSGAASATKTNSYTYRTSPIISSVSPASGTLHVGDTVTITGNVLRPQSTITVGGAPCGSVNASSDQTQATCVIGSGGNGTSAVVVDNGGGGGTASVADNPSLIFHSVPLISQINGSATATSEAAIGGGLVTITGSNFLSAPTVTIGGSACSGISSNATQITCTAPQKSTGAAAVIVTNSDGQHVTWTGTFTYQSLMYIGTSNSSSIFGASVDAGSSLGSLTSLATGATASSTNVKIASHPSLNMIYAVSGSSLSPYAISGATGALSAGTPISLSNVSVPNMLVIHPTGKFAYVADGGGSNSVTAIAIDTSTGALTEKLSVSASDTGIAQTNPLIVVVNSSGTYAFVIYGDTTKICSFSINQTTGNLTQIGTTCVPAPANTFAATSSSAGYLYAVGNGVANVEVYSISNAGVLSAHSSTALSGGTGAHALTIAGGYLYVANNDTSIGTYAINADGSLASPAHTAVSGTVSPDISSLAVDPTGKYLYAGDKSANKSVIAWDIGSGGSIVQHSGSAFSVNQYVTGIIFSKY